MIAESLVARTVTGVYESVFIESQLLEYETTYKLQSPITVQLMTKNIKMMMIDIIVLHILLQIFI